jgi:hypothetical protein
MLNSGRKSPARARQRTRQSARKKQSTVNVQCLGPFDAPQHSSSPHISTSRRRRPESPSERCSKTRSQILFRPTQPPWVHVHRWLCARPNQLFSLTISSQARCDRDSTSLKRNTTDRGALWTTRLPIIFKRNGGKIINPTRGGIYELPRMFRAAVSAPGMSARFGPELRSEQQSSNAELLSCLKRRVFVSRRNGREEL